MQNTVKMNGRILVWFLGTKSYVNAANVNSNITVITEENNDAAHWDEFNRHNRC